jgi:hypothetical protein
MVLLVPAITEFKLKQSGRYPETRPQARSQVQPSTRSKAEGASSLFSELVCLSVTSGLSYGILGPNQESWKRASRASSRIFPDGSLKCARQPPYAIIMFSFILSR